MSHPYTFTFSLLALLSLCLLPPAFPQGGTSVTGAVPLLEDRGFLGIYSGEMNDDKAELLNFDTEYGSYVRRVIPGSGAARAGLRPFDYIIGINDDRVGRQRDLTDLLEAYEPGDEVTVHFIRDGERTRVRATLGYRSSTGYADLPPEEQPFFGISPHDDNEDDELGVRVEVIGNSTAESLGLQTGDLILAINDHPMIDWSDIGTAIDDMIVGRTIRVRYERGGSESTVSGAIRSRRETDQAREMTRDREPAFIGVYTEQISAEKADKLGFDNPYGSYVSGIIPGTAAAEAGLKPFDFIYGVDQYRTGEFQNLGHILKKYRAGDQATVHFYRQGRRESLPITFGTRDQRTVVKVSPCDDPFLGVRHSFDSNDLEGVGITVVPNSTASEIGLQDGDVITRIDGYPMLEWGDVGIAIDQLRVGQEIAVEFLRDGNRMKAKGIIKSECETRRTEQEIENQYPFDDQPWPSGRREAPRRTLPPDMDMEIEDLSAREAEAMRAEHGIEMPTEQNLRIEGLNLFPNPSSGQFNLQFNLPERGETAIRIFNASGRLIYNYELGNYSGEFNDEVDISQNGTGSYFLEIRQNRRSVTKKIILSRR